jgi:hypothetical protein
MLDFDQIYAIIISSVFVPFLAYLMKLLFDLLNAQISKIKSTKLQEAIKNAKMEMEKAVYLAVSETQQTFVEALKADGEFSAADAKLAFNKSMERAKQIMSASGQAVLIQAAIDINALITAEIEANLAIVKEERAASAAGCTTTTTTTTTDAGATTDTVVATNDN